jgi:hypothetical protein
MIRYFKFISGLVCFLILANNIWVMSRWTESRGVYDDFCYLRQAHLFQQHGLGGLNTDVGGDDDHYLSTKMKAMNWSDWTNPMAPPCHTPMPATKKMVIQYPPGTGFALAMFPQGYQVIPLFGLATVAIFCFGLLAIYYANTMLSIALTATFADLALYMMINPSKASYSMAPTMVVCALAGFLTAHLFVKTAQRHRMFLTILVGLLLGLAVNFRLANLFLSAGYFLFFGLVFSTSRKLQTFLQGGLFGVSYLAGIAPTLIANAINAGSPFSTTYGADPADLSPPTIDVRILLAYATDPQFYLLILAGAWVVSIARLYRGGGIRSVALITGLNLTVNVAFFMTHPTFNPYYTIPIAMLSLWSLLFASLMRPAESGDDSLPGQAAKA